MIAPAKQIRTRKPSPPWHADFLRLVPIIANHARIAFRGLGAEARQEAIAESVASALVAYCRLLELGKPRQSGAPKRGGHLTLRGGQYGESDIIKGGA